MRDPDVSRPVIHGTFFREGVRECDVLYRAAVEHDWPELGPGHHVGRLQRADGCRAEIQFVVEPDDGPDALRRKVLTAAEGRWRHDPVVGAPGLANGDVRLAFWSGSKVRRSVLAMVEPTMAVKAVDAEDALLVLDGGFGWARTATMQVVTGDGASYFIRIPPVARLQGIHVRLDVLHVEDGRDGAPRPLPLSVCDGPPSMAYNAFLAFGQHDAAFSLGEAVADGLEGKGPERPGLIDCLVATQWTLRSHLTEAKTSRCMRALDAVGTQSDAATLRWLLAFDTRATGRETLGAELLTVFARLREEPPIFSETLRLLFERLPTARARLRSKEAWVPEHEAGYRFVTRFARALVWPSVHTTYRGNRPDRPDRDAVDDAATSKKKLVGLGEMETMLGSNGSVCVVQVRSAIRRTKVQQRTLRGLGLGRLNHARILIDTPMVRGMIRRVSHLVAVLPVDQARTLGARVEVGRRFGVPGGTLPARMLAVGAVPRFAVGTGEPPPPLPMAAE